MQSTSSIDLVICTYNNALLLSRTLQSLISQKVSANIEWSIWVINNNCTDQTAEVVSHFAAISPVPLKMVVETQQGLTAARHCGVLNTTAEWIAFIDDDCLLAEDWVEQAMAFTSKHPACGAFGGHIILHWEEPPPLYALKFPYAYAGKYHGESPKRRPWVAGAGMVLRRKALVDSGWVEKQFLADRTGNRLVSGGDMEIGMRIATKYEVWYNPACKLQHIIPPKRTSKDYLQRILKGLGASRHNVMALSWSGRYTTWLMYSLGISMGLLILCTFNALKDVVKVRTSAGPGIAFAPYLGWNSAVWAMAWMDKNERKALMGCTTPSN